MNATWVASDVHRGHDPQYEVWAGVPMPHVEVPARAESIRAALQQESAWRSRAPVAHGSAPILAIHDPAMVTYLETAWDRWNGERGAVHEFVADTVLHPALREGMGPLPRMDSPEGRLGEWCFESMTPITGGTYGAAREAVDIALTAADLALDGERLVYGLCRPPGHHAPRAAFGGYCYLNNAAIAAQSLAERSAGRVAVLDLDVHHGNGTQQIFYRRAEVLYASLHADPARAYPYFTGYADETGAGPGAGTTLNIPLAAGCGDGPYLEALDTALERAARFVPGILVVSLGIDTYELDPLGDIGLTPTAYHAMGARVASLGIPLIVLQEGGYHVAHLGRNVRSWLRGAGGQPPLDTPPGSSAPSGV